jgi:hypothetical protein
MMIFRVDDVYIELEADLFYTRYKPISKGSVLDEELKKGKGSAETSSAIECPKN